jgi:hypothetical protein
MLLKKIALLVGINYVDTNKELSCCINDIKTMTKKLVKEFGFDLKDIQLLIEDVATKKNILDGIERLVQELESGDIGVLVYAGHGTQVPELPPINEPDMLDEAIVPYDGINKNKIVQENLIRDDELSEKLSRLATGTHFLVIFDSCHSAESTRDVLLTARRVVLNDSIAYKRIKEIVSFIASPEVGEVQKRNLFAGMNHILLSGCKTDQLSYEYEDGSNGFLTKELVNHMKKGITYEELYNLVRNGVMEVSKGDQEPQIEGTLLTRKILE